MNLPDTTIYYNHCNETGNDPKRKTTMTYRLWIYNYELDQYEIWQDFDDAIEADAALYDLRFDDCKCYIEKVTA